MNRKEWYALILKEIEVRFDRGSSIQWKNRDFEDLSLDILETTKVLISVSTLKRIFGSVQTKGDYYPQRTTLLALKEFSGVKHKEPRETSYDNIIEEHDHEHPIFMPTNGAEAASKNTHKPQRFNIKYALITLGIIAIISVVYFMLYSNSEKLDPQFKLISTEGKYSYLTAKFSYDISKFKDSVFFKRPGYQKSYLPKNENSYNMFCNSPGTYFVSLISKKKTITDSLCVLVESKGWETFVDYYQGVATDRMATIDIAKAIKDKCFHLTKDVLAYYGIDTNRYILCHFNNFKQTKEIGDTFVFDAIIKNTVFWNTLRCNAFEIQIAGDKGNIKFEILNKGCSTYSYVVLSEKYFSGITSDLSSLTDDFSEFRHIKIVNSNKTVSFLLEDKEIYKNSYENSIGNLVGVSIIFHGSGYVKSISLKKESDTDAIFEF